jgi:formylglycine-generating enzyme required for sulfatase activity
MTLDLGKKVTMKLVLIPAGKFIMGSPDSEQKEAAKSLAAELGVKEEDSRKWFKSEGPQHEVTISKPFYMGVYHVTQEQYEQVMGQNPSDFKGAQKPVDTVSWDEAVAFCKKLSAKTGKTVRLPTVAEWEYACRSGTKTPFNTGETISTDQANYNGDYLYGSGAKGVHRGETTPVGSFKPNAFGLYDMHGNVYQWCFNWFWPGSENAPETEKDPGNRKSAGKVRLLRGGAWSHSPQYCRSATGTFRETDHRSCDCGFRVAVDADAD